MSGASPVVLWRVEVREAASLSSNAKLVAFVLSTYMDKYGRNAWAEVATIKGAASLSRRTVQRALRELEEAGLVQAVVRPGRTTVYHAKAASVSHPGASASRAGVSDSHPGGVSQSPELDLELVPKNVIEVVGDPHGEIEERTEEERLRSRRIRRGIESCSDREALLAFAASDGALLELLDFFSAVSSASEADKRAAIHARTAALLEDAA